MLFSPLLTGILLLQYHMPRQLAPLEKYQKKNVRKQCFPVEVLFFFILRFSPESNPPKYNCLLSSLEEQSNLNLEKNGFEGPMERFKQNQI